MDVPLPLAGEAGPLPQRRLSVPPFDAPPTPEEFDRAVAQCAAQTGEGPLWANSLTSMASGRAALLGCREPVWCTFLCDEEGRTPTGTDVLAALIVMEGMGCAAFGLEGEDPLVLAEQYERIAPYATVPLVWPASLPRPELELAPGSALADPDVIPCASGTEARFLTPDVDVGETLRCGPDLVEEILESEDTRGALKIAVLEEDDLWALADAQYVVRDALCIVSDVPELLERSLRYYQGRAFWDGTEDLEDDFLSRLSRRYGLILL